MLQENNSEDIQVVSFLIGDTVFGIDVMSTKEVLYLLDYTEIPDTLPFMKGVIDLRGEVVPIIDARIKFNLPERKYDEDTVVIIFEIEQKKVGFVVDRVQDVITIPVNEIQKGSHYRSEIDVSKDYVHGIIKTDEMLIIILKSEKILSSEEIVQTLNS